MPTSPTQRSLALLRKQGWSAYVVERWVAQARKRIDVAGFGDILAWKPNEGVLLIQMELYSEFDDQTPIFKTNIPTGNEWKDWQKAFEKAGNRIEKAVIAQISNWDHGDGFDTLKASVPARTWEEALTSNLEPVHSNLEKHNILLASDRE